MGVKTAIYAPRLRGDIDLGLEPSRIDGKGNKQWARQDFPGFRIAGQPDQLITAYSSTQKFAIGTKRVEYGRTFRYAKAGATFTTADSARLVKNGNYDPEMAGHVDVDGFYGDLVDAIGVGGDYLDLEETTITERVENFFQGGYVTTFADIAGVRNFTTYYVVWSDELATVNATNYTRIYLDHPVITPISATNGIHLFNSPYSKVIDGESAVGWASYVGRVLCGDVPINNYFWLQTEGPAWVACYQWNNVNNPGYNASKRDVYGYTNGAIINQTTTGTYQRVGYLLAATIQGTGDMGGCSFIMLQLE